MKYAKLYPFVFPVLVGIIGLILYKVLGYEPNVYTILFNIGVAFILSPRVKTFNTQDGKRQQVTWLFFKKSKIISE